jgi:hypothetical protein
VQPWPSSPPLQSMTIERRDGDAMVALAVGMAGRSHWSASLQLCPEMLQVELAVRVNQMPESLSSRYSLLTDCTIQRHDADGSTTVDAPSDSPALKPVSKPVLKDRDATYYPIATVHHAPSQTRWLIELPGDTLLDCDGGAITLRPAQSVTRFPSTVLWRYRLRELVGPS